MGNGDTHVFAEELAGGVARGTYRNSPYERNCSQFCLVAKYRQTNRSNSGTMFKLSAGRNPPALAPLTPWVWPTAHWQRIHVDFAQKDGKDYLIVVDAHSHWPEIFWMRETATTAIINILQDLFSRYGVVVQLTSDNGPQFRSAEFEHFMKLNGVKHVRIAVYHPASNCLAERMLQSFKRHLGSGNEQNLQQRIHNFLLMYRSTNHPFTGRTLASLFLGRELRTRLLLVSPSLADNVLKAPSNHMHYHDQHVKFRESSVDSVLVKDIRYNKW